MRACARVEVAHHLALCDLEHQALGRQPRILQGPRDVADERLAPELARRQVHGDGDVAVDGMRPLPSGGRLAGLPQHLVPELLHQADLLGDRDELARPDEAAFGRIPAGERLERDDPAVAEIDDRLEDDADLVPLEPSLELDGELVPAAHLRVHLRCVPRRAVLPGLLRGVHRDVGVQEQLVGGDPRARERDPDARVEPRLAAVEHDRPLDRLQHARWRRARPPGRRSTRAARRTRHPRAAPRCRPDAPTARRAGRSRRAPRRRPHGRACR